MACKHGEMTNETRRIVQLTSSRAAEVASLDQWAFAQKDPVDSPETITQGLDWDRTYGVEVVGDQTEPELAAIHSSYALKLAVPGGIAKTSGLTWVGVHPQYRRRGILRSMIGAHFDHCRANGECLSVLTAAEIPIYTRFGYGQAAQGVRMTVPRGAELFDVEESDDLRVRIEKVSDETHREVIHAIHAAEGTGPTARPGWVLRVNTGMQRAMLQEHEKPLKMESPRVIIVERQGDPRAYALFRREFAWNATGPAGAVHINESAALDPAAAHALWKTVLDMDLMSRVETAILPLDDALVSLLTDIRSAAPTLSDNIFARIIDLPEALAARRYSIPIDMTIAVTDQLLPANAGTWRLAGDLDSAHATRTEESPDLTLDIRALSSLYLGGMSAASLAAAGLIRQERDGALQQFGTAFSWWKAPIASWGF